MINLNGVINNLNNGNKWIYRCTYHRMYSTTCHASEAECRAELVATSCSRSVSSMIISFSCFSYISCNSYNCLIFGVPQNFAPPSGEVDIDPSAGKLQGSSGVVDVFVFLAFLVLVISSNPIVGNYLMQKLEYPYKPIPINTLKNSDAIIVLTGGSRRLEVGITLLENDKADLLFVSGVNEKVTRSDILNLLDGGKLPKSTKFFDCCIMLGYTAEDTRGNARESLQWVRDNSLSSIILVTSNYHMQRAYLEFKSQNPNIKITQYPVSNGEFRLSSWLIHSKRFVLLFLEFHKLILTNLRAYCCYP